MKKYHSLLVLSIILFFSCHSTDFKHYDYKDTSNLPEMKMDIMVIAAHPDDEAIFFGGAIPYYAQVLKKNIILVNMTTDWLTRTGERKKNSYIREEELREASIRYGLKQEPIFALLQQNNKFWPIEGTWDRWSDYVRNSRGIAEGKYRSSRFLAEQIRKYKPDVIMTHGLNGEYDNPDHQATAFSAIAAFDLAAGKETILDDGETPSLYLSAEGVSGEIWQVKKLYLHYSADHSETGINHLFHDYWEDKSIAESSPRETANYGLKAHSSQGEHFVSSVYDNRGRASFSRYPSELWTLYRSEVGADRVLNRFSIKAIDGELFFENWAKGDFLQNIP
jgi:LmbE family N-acetylglucosaminyl deacetylase